MRITTAVPRPADTAARQPRGFVPQQLYKGHVVAVHRDGGVEVLINQQRFTTHAPHAVRPGDLLSLRLLELEPAPQFAVVGILQRDDLQRRAAVQLRGGWPEAVALLRGQDPGLGTLLQLWQRFPQQLAQLSARLPPLLGHLQARGVQRNDLLQPGRLKTLGSSSWGLGSGLDAEDTPALIPLLARLLSLLQPTRRLQLERGQPVLTDCEPSAAQKLLPMAAYYQAEQESDSAAPLLRQLLSLNVEQSLLALVSNQLQGHARSNADLSIWIMQLWLHHSSSTLPLELFCQQRRHGPEQRWQLDFSLQLPQAGRVEVTLLVKFPSVALRLCSDDAALRDRWRARREELTRDFKACGLQLQEFLCVAAEEIKP